MPTVRMLIVINFAATLLNAQNLVLNPSFEEYDYCLPLVRYTDSIPCKGWVGSNNSTPDYYNRCSLDTLFGVPQNWNGYYPAKEGFAYVGIAVISNGDMATEHIVGNLITPLKKDSTYLVSFYMCFTQYTSDFSAKGVGAFFSNTNPFVDIFANETYFNTLKPEYKANVYYPHFLSDTDWVRVEGYYQAKGGEKYITLGLFWEDDQKLSEYSHKLNDSFDWKVLGQLENRVKKILIKPNKYVCLNAGKGDRKMAYYLFDEISVTQVKK